MALRATSLLAGVGLLAIVAGCTPEPVVATSKDVPLGFRDAPARKGVDTVAILTPLEPETQELWSALVLELGDDFNLVTIPVDKRTAPDDLSREIGRVAPECVIIVDNRTVGLYGQLQAMRPEEEFPPAVVVMTSFLDRSIGSLRRAIGIAYEVPAVSSVVALREVASHKVERVGVVHRQRFATVVQAQTALAAVEKVELLPIVVPDKPTPAAVEEALDLLVLGKKVDALWVLNDNGLLTPELLIEGWLPVLSFKPIPVMVGVSALVHPDVHFGTLAVLPNHARLGVQAADLVFDLADNDWQLEDEGHIELPLSVMTVVDVKQVGDHFGLKSDALAKIDKAVK